MNKICKIWSSEDHRSKASFALLVHSNFLLSFMILPFSNIPLALPPTGYDVTHESRDCYGKQGNE